MHVLSKSQLTGGGGSKIVTPYTYGTGDGLDTAMQKRGTDDTGDGRATCELVTLTLRVHARHVKKNTRPLRKGNMCDNKNEKRKRWPES